MTTPQQVLSAYVAAKVAADPSASIEAVELATGLGVQHVTAERNLITGEVITSTTEATGHLDLSGVFESLSDTELVLAIGRAHEMPSRAKNLAALLEEATRRTFADDARIASRASLSARTAQPFTAPRIVNL